MKPMSSQTPDDAGIRAGDFDPRTLLDAGLVGELIVEVRSLARSVKTFAEGLAATDQRVGELEDLRRRNRVLGYVVAAAVTLLAAAVIVATVGGFLAFRRLADIADANAANGRVLIECTTPSPPPGAALDDADVVHECAERSAAGQVAAIDAIALDVARAAFCATQHATEEAVLECLAESRARAATTTTTQELRP